MAPPMTGRAMGQMAQGLGIMMNQMAGAETLYAFIIITCGLMIYFGTRELYELSSHKGIRYFRSSFLFFSIAFFFRYFLKSILFYFGASEVVEISNIQFFFIAGNISLFGFVYFSSMAVFFLLYSVMSKKWRRDDKIIYIFHAIAVLLATIAIVTDNPLVYLGINVMLLLFMMFIFYTSKKQNESRKSKNSLHIIYTLIFLFWTLSVIDILVPSFFSKIQTLIYICSSGIFLAMLYKVLRKTG